MLFKSLSLCALILSGAASAVAQGIIPGRYIIQTNVNNTHGGILSAQVRNPGFGQNLVIPNTPVTPGRDQWDLLTSEDGSVIMRSVAFGTFLRVASDEPGTAVTTGPQDQATSFSVTSAGPNLFHVNVAAQDRVWTVQTILPKIFPPPDSGISIQGADGGPEQLWEFLRVFPN